MSLFMPKQNNKLWKWLYISNQLLYILHKLKPTLLQCSTCTDFNIKLSDLHYQRGDRYIYNWISQMFSCSVWHVITISNSPSIFWPRIFRHLTPFSGRLKSDPWRKENSSATRRNIMSYSYIVHSSMSFLLFIHLLHEKWTFMTLSMPKETEHIQQWRGGTTTKQCGAAQRRVMPW